MRNYNLKRLVSVLLSFSLVVGAVTYRPQKANAFAITSGTIVAGVCAIMASIGVTYWAKTSTDAQDYIAGKLDEYLRTLTPSPETLQDWLGLVAENTSTIFEILSGNRLRFTANVGNKIIDFVRWLVERTGIASGGDPIVETYNAWAGQPIYVSGTSYPSPDVWRDRSFLIAAFNDGDQVTKVVSRAAGLYVCRYDNYALFAGKDRIDYTLYFGRWDGASGNKGTYTVDVHDTARSLWWRQYFLDVNRWETSSIPVYANQNEALDALASVVDNGAQLIDIVKVTPSERISIPDTIIDDDTLDIVPSAVITEDMTVDEAADSIMAGVASENGLSATVEGDVVGVPTAWVWLSDLITGIGEKIDGLAHGIAKAIAGLFCPADGFVADFVDSLYATFSERVGVLTYPLAVAESFMMRFLTEPVSDPVLKWGAIQEPFSSQVLIQAGSYNLNDIRADPQMVRVYDILQLVLKTGMAFALFDLCRKKYNAIIHGGAS